MAPLVAPLGKPYFWAALINSHGPNSRLLRETTKGTFNHYLCFRILIGYYRIAIDTSPIFEETFDCLSYFGD